ncbi:hypothetical protein [Actinomadura gamaensis]|uniref:Alpha/beta hydrolase n=1 Tax=Actinomadura gamaensis TaxID=1763541 RepID=A0ABV9U240_9ACTN
MTADAGGPAVRPSPAVPERRRRRLRRRGFVWIGAAGALVVLAGTGLTWWTSDHARLPAPSGPAPVGRARLTFTENVPDGLGDSPTSPRQVAVTLLYPAVRSGPASPYAPGRLAGPVAADMHVPAFLLNQMVRPHLRDGASAASRTPLLVFLPGWSTPAQYYTSTLEDIASHGYAVAAVWPTDCSDFTVLGHRVVRQTRAGRDPTLSTPDPGAAVPVRRRVADYWLRDASTVIDRLLAAGSPWRAHLDPGRVGAFGNSFGGAVAAELTARDRRVRAAADLGGGPVEGIESAASVRGPIMLLRADDRARGFGSDQAERDRTAYAYSYSSAKPLYDFVLRGFLPETFVSDKAVLARRFARARGPSAHDTVTVPDRLLVSFFDHHLRGTPGPFPPPGTPG